MEYDANLERKEAEKLAMKEEVNRLRVYISQKTNKNYDRSNEN